MKIMPLQSNTKQALLAETAELRARLEEAEETLRAIRNGEVDAIIVGEQVYMLEKAGTSSNLFRGEVLAQINDAVIAVDNDMRVTYLNPAAERQYGVTATEALGRLLNELFGYRWERPDDEAKMLVAIEATGNWRGENIHITQDGAEIHVESVVNRLRDESGTPIGLLAVIRDISERKQAEVALRASQQQIANDLNAMMQLYEVGNHCVQAGSDFDQCLRRILEAAICFTGADKGILQLIDPESGSLVIRTQCGFEEPFLKFFAHVRGDGCACTCDKACQSAQRVVVEDVTQSEIFAGQPSLDVLLEAGVHAVQSTPLLSSTGNLQGVISTYFGQPQQPGARELRIMDLLARQATDFLELKKTEEALRAAYEQEAVSRAEAQAANRSKDEFISLISHELRSPLNSILGYNRILRSNPQDAEQIKQASDVIERNARTQLQLIEDLLDIARVVSGKLRLDLSPTDVVPVLAEVLNEVRPAAEAKGIELRAHYNRKPEMVNGDSTRLHQVIGNLLSNAIKFTPEGGRIELWLKRTDEGLSIVVSDTGKGIAPEILPYIFERFRQADSSSSRRHGGLGLGLALVRHLVELHGGTVEAESEGIGLGSIFTVKLPRTVQYRFFEVEPPALSTEGANQLPDKTTIEGVRVLAVDDQQEAREALTNYLSKYGANVTAVSSGVEAMAIHASPQNGERPDVFICDIAMPDEDGYAVMKRVRALEGERRVKLSQRIPAIALTAMAGRENWVSALRAGFNTHIVKPVDPEELVMLIYNLVGGRRDDA